MRNTNQNPFSKQKLKEDLGYYSPTSPPSSPSSPTKIKISAEESNNLKNFSKNFNQPLTTLKKHSEEGKDFKNRIAIMQEKLTLFMKMAPTLKNMENHSLRTGHLLLRGNKQDINENPRPLNKNLNNADNTLSSEEKQKGSILQNNATFNISKSYQPIELTPLNTKNTQNSYAKNPSLSYWNIKYKFSSGKETYIQSLNSRSQNLVKTSTKSLKIDSAVIFEPSKNKLLLLNKEKNLVQFDDLNLNIKDKINIPENEKNQLEQYMRQIKQISHGNYLKPLEKNNIALQCTIEQTLVKEDEGEYVERRVNLVSGGVCLKGNKCDVNFEIKEDSSLCVYLAGKNGEPSIYQSEDSSKFLETFFKHFPNEDLIINGKDGERLFFIEGGEVINNATPNQENKILETQKTLEEKYEERRNVRLNFYNTTSKETVESNITSFLYKVANKIEEKSCSHLNRLNSRQNLIKECMI